MLTLKNIRKSFGTRRILNGVSFSLGEGQRVALVGENGVGKSTLLKIIAGLETADRGEIVRKKNTLIGYLPQESIVAQKETMLQFLQRESGLHALETAMEKLALRLSDPEAQAEYDVLREQFERLGAYAFQERARFFLEGLKLGDIDFSQRADTLSGGEKRKLSLVAVLLRGVDLLLLDEPTNNLDLPALLWLEGYLGRFRGTLLVASHDRTFLDRVVKKVVEIDIHQRQAQLFAGNWSTYAEMKARALRRHRELYARQEDERERMQNSALEKRSWIEAAKIKRPRDNDKMLRGYRINRAAQKHGARAKALETKVRQLEKLEKPFERQPLQFTFAATNDRESPKLILRRAVTGYRQGFSLGPISLTLRHGERLALLGENGAGKSTLLKLITGRLKARSGTVQRDRYIRFGDLMQEHENLDRTETPLQYFARVFRVFDREPVLLHLAHFNFTPEFAEIPIGRFSPGERVRFAFSTLVYSGTNALVLDEPTNHLDLEAIEALEEALESFSGSIILVTHDRMFLKRLRIDRFLLLESGQARFLLDWEAYEQRMRAKVKPRLKRLVERLGERRS